MPDRVVANAPSLLLLPWRRQPFPAVWGEIFGRSAPLHLEIGFGDGRFTATRALACPAEDFVGLEISGVSVRRALKRLRRDGVGNVQLMKVGASFALRNLFAPDSLSSVVVNFPDPWPKERHLERRLLSEPFFRLAASRLRPGGEVRLATDHPDYLAFALAHSGATGLFASIEHQAPPEVFATKYALKWREQGKPLHYRVFRYLGAAVAHPPPLERPETMPHALLQGDLPDAFDFEKRVTPYGDGHVVLHEIARVVAAPTERWLVRATVDEAEFKQQLLVAVQRRAGGELIVRLESFGDPIVTPTVRGAVHAVTEWLLGLGGLELRVRNY